MKKTLVAMAVLAASGATMAQVTITGNLAMGYKMSTTQNMGPTTPGAGINAQNAFVANALLGGTGGNPVAGASGSTTDSAGFGVDTSEIFFTAKEDLGGGMSAVAQMSVDTLNRGGVAGGDASIKVTTSIGRFTVQTYKPVDYLSRGISGVDAGVDMSNKVFAQRGFNDSVGFDTKLGPVYLGFSHNEQASSSGGITATTSGVGAGLGIGGAGAAGTVGQRNNSFAVTYVGGPLIAGLNYLAYDNRTDTMPAFAAGTAAQLSAVGSIKDVIRGQISYDLGVAKLGFGLSQTTTVLGTTVSDGLLAASMPLGALTLSANYATESIRGVPAISTLGMAAGTGDDTRSGYGLAAKYDLSKRTSMNFGYASWSPVSTLGRNTETTILLAHSF